MSNRRDRDLAPKFEREDNVPLILAVDTTSRRRSVAVSKGSQVVGLMAIEAVASHSWQLHDEIDLLLKKLGLALDQIEVFGVTTGPGSFTGVRVGLATIKGFAQSLQKPVVGVTSLEAHARAAGVSGLVCACVDALRDEIYIQLFQVNPDGAVEALTEPSVTLPSLAYASLINEPKLTFIGDGVLSSLEILEHEAATVGHEVFLSPMIYEPKEGWHVVDQTPILATSVAALTMLDVRRGNTCSAVGLAALYVRPSAAEVKRQAKNRPKMA